MAHLERDRALEGDEIVAEIELDADTAVDLLELHLVLPRGLTVVDGDNPLRRCGSSPARSARVPLTLRCDRWGSVELGDIRLRARGRIGMLVWEGRVRRPHRLRSTRGPSSCRASSRRSTPSSRPATSSRGSGRTVSSSPTRAASCPAIACARSTGGRARAAAS